MPLSSKSKFSLRHISLLDMTVWIISLVLIGALALLAGLSDPSRRGAQVAYLYPVMGGTQNLWLASLNNPADAVQLTEEAGGIYNFDVSDDGRFIVYSARDGGTGLNDLFLLDLQTHRSQRLTTCTTDNADCRTPAIRPDGKVIAYERMEYNSSGNGVPGGPGAVRVWLIDMSQQPYTTRPLTDDAQFVGYSPQWEQSGETLAFFSADMTNPGIMLYNFAPREGEKALKFIPASNGVVGSISPDGLKLVFPDMTETSDGYSSVLKEADLADMTLTVLTPEQEPAEDNDAAWHPDGKRVAIARKYSDERRTPGFQIYLFDPTTGDVQPLAYDKRYSHGFFEWNKTGDKLLYQRFALNKADAQPEVAVRDLVTGETTVIMLDGFQPRWVLP